jgi:flavin reductase (DIM6/NTAB) family NADH-FMN oxidoreductase RutF
MKREIDLKDVKWLLEAGCVVLVTTGSVDSPNVMTFSWQTPIHTKDPTLVLLAIARSRYTYTLLQENPELVINIPGTELMDAVNGAGSVSGRGRNKLRDSGLTAAAARSVRPPIIPECLAHLECRVRQFVPVESTELLICEVLRAEAEEEAFDGAWIPERARTLHHLGGGRYALLAPMAGSGKGR